jgi:FkbM family methyltransferase
VSARESWQTARHAARRGVFRLLPQSAQDAVDRRYYGRRLRAGTMVIEPELGILDRFVGPGDAVADIGANLGAFAVALSGLVGQTGSVLAFEPIPRTARLLRGLSRDLAPHPNIEVVEAAVGDEIGRAQIHLPIEGSLPNFYVASLYPIHHDRAELLDVEVTTLDEHRRRGGRPFTFVKIDVEGAELLVLRGASTVLSEDRPVVLCEIGRTERDGTHDAGDVEAALVAHGYVLHQLVDDALVPSSTSAPVAPSPNYVALPS